MRGAEDIAICAGGFEKRFGMSKKVRDNIVRVVISLIVALAIDSLSAHSVNRHVRNSSSPQATVSMAEQWNNEE